MARDYAQRSGGRRQTRSNGGTPGWVWMVVGLALGLAVAAFVYIKRPAGSLTAQDNAADEVVIGKDGETSRKAAEPKPKKERATLTLPPKEKERFTFYELLPNQEVVVPASDAKAEASKPAAGTASYIIQVASYRAKEEADRQKASLALLGVESRIETVTIDNAETFYRVRVGPLKDFGKVQIISNRLADNGIQALVVKVK